MVDDLLQPLSAIERLCDELLSQQYDSLAERQLEKITIIKVQSHSLTQLCEDCTPQPSSTQSEKRHRLWYLCSEFRTPTAIIETAIYFLHVYDTKHAAILNTQQQKHLQDMQNHIDILKAMLDKIGVYLQHYIEGADAG